MFPPAHRQQVPPLHRGAPASSQFADRMLPDAERRHPGCRAWRVSSDPLCCSRTRPGSVCHRGGTQDAALTEGASRKIDKPDWVRASCGDFQNKIPASQNRSDICFVDVVAHLWGSPQQWLGKVFKAFPLQTRTCLYKAQGNIYKLCL